MKNINIDKSNMIAILNFIKEQEKVKDNITCLLYSVVYYDRNLISSLDSCWLQVPSFCGGHGMILMHPLDTACLVPL